MVRQIFAYLSRQIVWSYKVQFTSIVIVIVIVTIDSSTDLFRYYTFRRQCQSSNPRQTYRLSPTKHVFIVHFCCFYHSHEVPTQKRTCGTGKKSLVVPDRCSLISVTAMQFCLKAVRKYKASAGRRCRCKIDARVSLQRSGKRYAGGKGKMPPKPAK